MLSYVVAADTINEYLRILETSVLYSLKEFCQEVLAEFGVEYMRELTETCLKRTFSINASHSFPARMDSIDCHHREWKNCPIAWVRQFKEKERKRSHGFVGSYSRCRVMDLARQLWGARIPGRHKRDRHLRDFVKDNFG